MKKFYCFALTTLLCAVFSSFAFASTVITAPLDSRPISVDYLGNLASLNGDEFFSPSKENLDYFTQTGYENRFANSKLIRDEINQLVSSHNTSDTTVIINTSSYFTGGLVGSRVGANYSSLDSALDDMYSLISTYKEPTYYVNLSMPRTLPETRLNSVWRDNKKINGICYYYLKYNPDSPNKSYLISNLIRVSPAQLILEYIYLENKQYELGKDNLAPWEKDFLDEFNKNYKNAEPYKSYIQTYIIPYRSSAQIYKKLYQWQTQGLIDEIVISVDDFQLPDSIIYLNANEPADWIVYDDNNTPVKFSYARTYLTSGEGSIYKQLLSDLGKSSAENSFNAKGKNINFIFGTDEVPQLIYARDLSKRANLSTNISTYVSGNANDISKYDMLGTNHLLKNAISFVSCSERKTKTEFDLYMYNYSDISSTSPQSAYDKLNQFYKKGNDIGLIEIFNGTPNYLYQKLLNQTSSDSIKLSTLSSYSAWNTSANAIGLGVAHSQVYGIAKSTASDDVAFIKSQVNILAQHLIEDGIYTHSVKRSLSNSGFKPTKEDTVKSETLYSALNPEPVLSSFNSTLYTLNNNTYSLSNCTLSEYNFPWNRLFDCFLSIDVDVEKQS